MGQRNEQIVNNSPTMGYNKVIDKSHNGTERSGQTAFIA